MTSEIDSDEQENEERNEVKIEELKPKMSNLVVVFRVIGKGETREVTSRHTGEIHQIADASVGDETGVVTFPLWNESIGSVEVGKSYKLDNGYTGLFKGNLQLKMGQHSSLEAAETEIESVNTDVDMSAEKHWGPPRRDHHSYQPRYGSGTYGGSYSRRRNYDRNSRRDRSRRRRW
ncbi:MAG: hypothetical protein ACFFCP_08070 [Promethearchaeota archaeon]